MYAVQYLEMRWPFGFEACYVSTAFRYVVAFGDWMSVAIVAFSRYITIARSGLSDVLLSDLNGVIAIALVWIYAFSLIVPVLTRVWY